MTIMIRYATRHLNLHLFCCKIGDANTSSLSLFRRLGFEPFKYSAVFQEHEMRLPEHELDNLRTAIPFMEVSCIE